MTRFERWMLYSVWATHICGYMWVQWGHGVDILENWNRFRPEINLHPQNLHEWMA